METVSEKDQPKGINRIDYAKLADYYNQNEIGEAVSMDQVYNISIFKESLERRGLVRDQDFVAYTTGGKTFVKRLTSVPMTKV